MGHLGLSRTESLSGGPLVPGDVGMFGPLSDFHILPPTIPSLLVLIATIVGIYYAYTGKPIRGKSYDVVIMLTAANILVFVLQGLSLVTYLYLDTLSYMSLRPAYFLAGLQWWSPFTSMFMHADFLHIFGNMLFLWFFGAKIADRMGRKQFVLMYLAAGLFADAVTLVGALFYGPTTDWLISNPTTPNLGASGAVYGLIGFTITAFPKEKVPIPIPLGIVAILHPVRPIVAAIVYIILNLVQFALGTRVAWWAHLAGMLLGVVWGIVWRVRGPRVRIDGMTGWGSGGPVEYSYTYRYK